jgi:hypothetical protein
VMQVLQRKPVAKAKSKAKNRRLPPMTWPS